MPHPLLARRREGGSNAFAADQALFEHFVAGQLACMRELTLLYAPHVNSYKRFVEGSFAPTAVAWGRDNRTCSMRVVGHGEALRVENRLPGADVNPYLALSAMIAAGLHGIEPSCRSSRPSRATPTNRTSRASRPTSTRPATRSPPARSRARRSARRSSTTTCNRARVELDAAEAAVTDWERYRGFERL